MRYLLYGVIEYDDDAFDVQNKLSRNKYNLLIRCAGIYRNTTAADILLPKLVTRGLKSKYKRLYEV